MLKNLSALLLLASLTLASITLSACNSSDADAGVTRIGLIANGNATFWNIADRGAQAAAAEFGVNATLFQPSPGMSTSTQQKDTLEDMLTRQYAGIAISPVDHENQTPLLDKVAAKTHLITQDSDAPNSKRLCFIGVDNYSAGRQCGALVKQAIPDGGEVMLFVGSAAGDNAIKRRQGVIDELLDRSHDGSRRDPMEKKLVSPDGKYTVLGCLTDGQDHQVAKANAEDALTKNPALSCMVGLYAYNAPMILEALRKRTDVKVVAFDEDPSTLRGIRDGRVFGTIVQDPYQYGYQSVRVLAALAKGDKSVLPESKYIDIPARRITRAEVADFEKKLKELLAAETK